jgi:colanic acid/amylovoran biosynthesis glycosyltransferase
VASKLAGLARRGWRITVISVDMYDPDYAIPGVEHLRAPSWDVTLPKLLVQACRETATLAVRSPRRLIRLLKALADPSLRSPQRSRKYARGRLHGVIEDLAWLRALAPLAHLSPDLAHFEWESSAVRMLPIVATWRCAMAMSCHGGLEAYRRSPEHEAIVAGLPRAFEAVDAVQCVSSVEYREAVSLGLDPEKAVVVPCAVDTDCFMPVPAPAPVLPEQMRIIAVGWLRWLKGYDFALQALRQLLDRGVPAHLDIYGGDPPSGVGERSERPRMRHAITELELQDHVTMHGFVKNLDLVRCYRSAHALLHSGVSEGLPVTILEAMACGLPVVASDVSDIGQALRDGLEGFIVPPRRPSASAEALERLWLDPELRARMGRSARARAVAEFGLDRQLQALDELYARALAHAGRRGSR